MKKILVLIAVLASAVCILTACSADTGNTDASASENQETSTVLQQDTGKTIPYAITETEAHNTADVALKEEIDSGNMGSAEDYQFESIELLAADDSFMAYNGGYGETSETENTTGHSYYAVSYRYTESIADVAYFCIDAMNGDILYSGYMGD